jgi:hypothetical protein
LRPARRRGSGDQHLAKTLKIGQVLTRRFPHLRFAAEINPRNGSVKFFGRLWDHLLIAQAEGVAEKDRSALQQELLEDDFSRMEKGGVRREGCEIAEGCADTGWHAATMAAGWSKGCEDVPNGHEEARPMRRRCGRLSPGCKPSERRHAARQLLRVSSLFLPAGPRGKGRLPGGDPSRVGRVPEQPVVRYGDATGGPDDEPGAG